MGLATIDDLLERACAEGWEGVIAKRGFGKTVFLPIRDQSGDLQLFLNIDHCDAGDFGEVVPDIDVGDLVCAEGRYREIGAEKAD